jgi:hypothetical protein
MYSSPTHTGWAQKPVILLALLPAEVIGALVSVLVIRVLTGLLFCEAVLTGTLK